VSLVVDTSQWKIEGAGTLDFSAVNAAMTREADPPDGSNACHLMQTLPCDELTKACFVLVRRAENANRSGSYCGNCNLGEGRNEGGFP